MVYPPGRILRVNVHAYKYKYTKILEQLVDRHRMIKNPTDKMGIPDVALNKCKVRMNTRDDELEDFMMSAVKKCRTFKTD